MARTKATPLTEALRRWRDERTQVLAEEIDALTEAALAGWTAPKVRTNVQFEAAWVEAIGGEATLGWAARHLTSKLPGDSSDTRRAAFEARLARIARAAPDPRFGHALAQLLILDGDYAFRDALVPVVIRHGDARTSALLAAAQPIARGFIAEGIAKILAKRPAPRTTPAPSRTRKTVDIDRLFAEVRADPDSDAARTVLADALQTAGDPRGELIALQLSGTEAGARRADELLGAHAKAWVGDLRSIMYRGQFSRGFLTRLELDGAWRATEAGWDQIVNSPMLATVEDLIPGRTKGPIYARLVSSPAMRALRRIAVWEEATLEALARTPATLVHITAGWAPRQKRGVNAVADRVLPACARHRGVTSLDLDPAYFEALAATDLLKRIDTLGLGYELGPGLALWSRLPSNVRTIIIGRTRVLAECIATQVAWEGALRIERRGKTAVGRVWGRHMLYALREHLRELPKLERLEIAGAGDLEPELRTLGKRAKLELAFVPLPRRTGYVTNLHK